MQTRQIQTSRMQTSQIKTSQMQTSQMQTRRQVHPIPPLFDKNSEILILGSFPSVKSREAMFFYGHPQNRFWKVMASLFDSEVPTCIEEKRELMLKNHIALWDVIAECDIAGSSDSSIKKVKPNDLHVILDHSDVRKIFLNGKTAEKMYRKYIEPCINVPFEVLPSTSPANAAWSLQRLTEEWGRYFFAIPHLRTT